ncbi:MAG: ribosome recycling factor [Clostridia bacterium]
MEYNVVEEKMSKTISHLQDEFANIRAGRANPAILNRVMVDYYGTLTPINQVGTISVPEARQILVTPWDKSMLGMVEKAIQKADIGINPLNDGNSIRLTFPELNEQRRKELTKDVKSLGENAKVVIRNSRRDAIESAKSMQKNAEITEDELKAIEEKVQKITDKYILEIDNNISAKEKELMEV